jgi:polygalacturonase
MPTTRVGTLRVLLIASLAWWSGLSSARAEDSRHVTEPQVPPACAALAARLSAPSGALADADEDAPDTKRIQDAIDACAGGKAVVLEAAGPKNVFLAGPLRLKAGVTLLVSAGVALFASRNPRDYDVTPGSCGIVAEQRSPCQPFILAEKAPGAAIMGDGAIDGRGGATLRGQNVTWWDLAKEAKIKDRFQACPRLIAVRESNDFTIFRITLRNAPNAHVVATKTNGFTAWGVKIKTPKTARNTDGINPDSSSNVTIAHCSIDTGDDNVAIKAGASGPVSNVTIAHNHFYAGHGMSIGSETRGGVRGVKVVDLTLDGTDRGIRIKSDRSRGGLVQGVSYENVCMRNVGDPILLDTKYTTLPGDNVPVYRDIVLRDVTSVTPGVLSLLGFDEKNRIGVTLDNVNIAGPRNDVRAKHADIKLGPRRGNFLPAGIDINVTNSGVEPAAPLDCSTRFVPFTEPSTAPRAAMKVPAEDATLYVAASGSGDFYSVQRAIDAAPATGAIISIAPGVYRERLVIDKRNIALVSPFPDASKTTIVFDKSAATAGGTFNSATVEVRGRDFRAENLTFFNDYNRAPPQQPDSQALALLVTGDRAVFRNVRFMGNQDTLYAGSSDCTPPGKAAAFCTPSRQYFERCFIEGTVDFIFGNALAVFDGCQIHSKPHGIGYITAQGKQSEQEQSLFVFNRCKLTADLGVTHTWLGRPWRSLASVLFLHTEMGPHIEPAGWREWHPGETDYLKTVLYGEYDSTGPGAHPGERDSHAVQLSAAEAAVYDARRVLAGKDNWNPTTVK